MFLPYLTSLICYENKPLKNSGKGRKIRHHETCVFKKKSLTLQQEQNHLNLSTMYHLDPMQALFLVLALTAIFMIRGIKRGGKNFFDTVEDSNYELKSAKEWGYTSTYYWEMKKHDMMFRDGQWLPMYIENDLNNPYLIEQMRKKDLVLDRYNHWVFTGKTLEKLRNLKALYWQQPIKRKK
jgi:hypothetical protein